MTNNKVFIIAELSANHNGSKQTAIDTIAAAKRSGADAIKLQTYTADTITLNCKTDDFKIKQGTIWDGQYLYDLYLEAYTPWEWHADLFAAAKKQGMICFSSPFDRTAVDLLESLNNPIYKIASLEITDVPLIKYAARTMKPIIISTGIATAEDIQLAVDTCREVGNNDITLLKCTTSYPAPLNEANLIMISDLAKRFNVKVGISDHTLGHIAPVVAVAMGATVIEKHFIIDRSIGGPDASFSLNEKEFGDMVKAVRDAESAIGKVDYSLTEKQAKSKEFSRSLYVSEDIKAGDIISVENVRSVRPGFGLHPRYWETILGKKAKTDLRMGTSFKMEYIDI